MCLKYSVFIFIVVAILLRSYALGANLCDSACVCRLQKNNEKDFLPVNVDCTNSGKSIENMELPMWIHTLDLSKKAMSKVVKSQLFVSRTMEVLRLNRNNISAIEVGAFDLPVLKELDLSENNIEFLDPDVFQSTKNLEYLNLASNKFKHIPPMMFHHLSNLKKLVLDDNDVGKNLNEVDLFQRSGLALTNRIQIISLRGINFNKLPENFLSSAYDLRELTLSKNNLTTIPELPFTLEYLDLSDNPIEEIFAEDFSELPALKTLKLNNLRIKSVSDYLFASLKTLQYLELERNKNLTSMSTRAFGHEVLDDPTYFMLERLSLRGSRLNSLSQELETPLGQLTYLDLQGNPWKCDCKLVWLKEMQILPSEYEHLRCATPKTLYNAKIFELDAVYFTCPNRQKRHIGGAIAAISICLIFTTIALWLFFCLPKHEHQCEFAKQAYPNAAVYTLLPIDVNSAENRYWK